ncbi:MAG: protein kinase [Acidobacteriota bacterium]|nr:protein kinase [Acidobacteriota bacterium]
MKKCPTCGQTYQNDPTLCPADGTVLVKLGDYLIGQTLAGKYRIEERINEGGMGAVYRATHVLMEKTVAIKVLHPSLAADEKIVARFTREARAASRISHPHAISVTDFGESENGIVFLVMEYLRGQTLKEVIRRDGPLALERVVKITRQISGALDAAHAEGVVHRDLKSDNIMLVEGGGDDDWAKVLDFGIAKIQEREGPDPELTAPNLIIGTPQYMSPEQCSQTSEIDCCTDIYSLGIIVYEMLVGHVPFMGESATAIMLKHLQEPPPSVSHERAGLPPAVDQVVARALSKRREDRQQSAGELAESLAASTTTAIAGGVTRESSESLTDTERIVMPTSPFDSRETANDERDETTLVRPSESYRPADVGAHPAVPPPTAASFNPWKIMIPAAALVLVVLGVFFLMGRDSQPTANVAGEAPLASDPNAQAVEALAPPTGASESDITPAASIAPSVAPVSGATGAGGAATSPSVDNSLALPTDLPGDNSNASQNDNSAQNDNTQDEAQPSPTTTRNDNAQRSPTPQPTATPAVGDEDPPPPSATPRKPPTPSPQNSPPLPEAASPSDTTDNL